MQSARNALVASFFVAGVAVCVLGYHPLRTPVQLDNQTFFYIAERAASGVPPHVSVVNHKHALSELLSAAAMVAGRTVGVDDLYAARALSITLAAATIALVVLLSVKLTDDPVAAFFAGLAMLTFSGFLRQAVMGLRPQLFATFFLMWTLVATQRRTYLRAGVGSACAFLCWQPAGVVLAGVLAAAVRAPGARARTARVLAGVAAALCTYEAYFVVHGVLGEQLFQTWVMASYGALEHRPSVLETLRFLVNGDGTRSLAGSVIPFAAITMPVWGPFALRRARKTSALWSRPEVRAAAVTALGATAFTFVDHQAYPDKFVLLPFMALAAGIAARRLGDAFAVQEDDVCIEGTGHARKTISRHSAPVLMACTVFGALLVWRGPSDYRVVGDELAGQRALAAKIRAVDGSAASLWAVGCLHLLAFNHQSNYSPFGIFLDPRVRRYAGPGFRPLANGRMPRVILWARAGTFRFPWMEREYQHYREPALGRDSIRLWVRNPHRANDATEPAGAG